MPSPDELQRRKEQLRQQARQSRRQQTDRDALSEAIHQRILALPQYATARAVMCYVDFRSEVHTHSLLERMHRDGKRVAVPYCVDSILALFALESLADLVPGTMGILEPRAELRQAAQRNVAAGELDLVLVPGLAFDRQCGRIGYGKGYYDRLLHLVRADTTLVGLAFDCQVVAEVPLLPYDVRMDRIATPTAVYERLLPRFPSHDGG
jgi:5-formyltetrahydrofolate cyclo-ligase